MIDFEALSLNPYYVDDYGAILHGDNRRIMAAFIRAGIQFDHTITDPPYESEAHTKQVRQKGYEHHDLDDIVDYGAITRSELAFDAIGIRRWQYARLMSWLTKRWLIAFCQLEGAMLWRYALEYTKRLRYVRTMTWYKPNGMPQFSGDRPAANYENMVVMHPPSRCRWNGGGRGSVLTHHIWSNSKQGAQAHPTQKPMSLMEELILLFTDLGEIVFDPFAGGGTTGVAAKKHGRRYLLIEREERYCAIAVNRLRHTHPQRTFDIAESDILAPPTDKARQSLLDLGISIKTPRNAKRSKKQ